MPDPPGYRFTRVKNISTNNACMCAPPNRRPGARLFLADVAKERDRSAAIKRSVMMHCVPSFSLTERRPLVFHGGATCRFSCAGHTCASRARARARTCVHHADVWWPYRRTDGRMYVRTYGPTDAEDGEEAAAVPIFFVAAQGHALPSRATQ